MGDMYARGWATGSAIAGYMGGGGNNTLDRQLALKAESDRITGERQSVMEMAKNSAGIVFKEGQMQMDPTMMQFYSRHPGTAELALSKYEENYRKNQKEAEGLRQERIKTFDTTLNSISNLKKIATEHFADNPEMMAQYNNHFLVEATRALVALDPKIATDGLSKAVSMQLDGFDVAKDAEQLIGSRLVSLSNQRQKNPDKWSIADMDEYRKLYGALSKTSRSAFTDPKTVEAETKPFELVQVELKREGMKTRQTAEIQDQFAQRREARQEARPIADIKAFEQETGRKYNPAMYEDLQTWKQTKQGGAGPEFTPDAIKAMGTRYGQTGELPPMGMGKKAAEARIQIINQWAKDLTNTGETPEANAARQIAFKASTGELKQLQAQRGKVLAFARTAEKNLALAGELSEKIDRTGIPVVNRWLNAGRRAITGDVDLARFDAALRTAINEYAKVTSSATGGAVTSDTARKEVEDLLKAAMTKEQVRGVINLLVENELPNRIAGYEEQITTIMDALSNQPKQNPKSQEKGLKVDLSKYLLR